MTLEMNELVLSIGDRQPCSHFSNSGLYWIMQEDITQLNKCDKRLIFKRFRYKGHIFKLIDNTLYARCYYHCTGQCEGNFTYEKVNTSAKQFNEILNFIESVKK